MGGSSKRKDMIDAPLRQSKHKNRAIVNTLNRWNHVLGGGRVLPQKRARVAGQCCSQLKQKVPYVGDRKIFKRARAVLFMI